MPLMIGLCLYKASFAFVDRFCPKRCTEDNGCDMQETLDSIAKQVDLMKAFLLPEKLFHKFYENALVKDERLQRGNTKDLTSHANVDHAKII